MKSTTHTLPAFIASFLTLCFLFISPLSLAAEENNDMSLRQNVEVAQGKIKNFNKEKQMLVLKTSKGEKLDIQFDWNTALVGFSSLQEIHKGQGVKIWYTAEGPKKRAVKIEKKLEVGC